MPVHEAAEKGFGRGAEDYERARPSYPQALIDLWAEELPIRPRTRVLDLAAGTGKLTRLLLSTGADVVAVEPVTAMRRKLTVTCPDAQVLDGTAQAIPLEDRSVDVLTVGQAFHWFDTLEALAEMARVLRPTGGLGMAWNVQDERVGWVRDLERLVLRHGGERPYADSESPEELVASSEAFTPMKSAKITNLVKVSPDLVVTRVASTSFIAALPDARLEACLADVRELLSTHPETAGRDRLDYPYLTIAFWCHKR